MRTGRRLQGPSDPAVYQLVWLFARGENANPVDEPVGKTERTTFGLNSVGTRLVSFLRHGAGFVGGPPRVADESFQGLAGD